MRCFDVLRAPQLIRAGYVGRMLASASVIARCSRKAHGAAAMPGLQHAQGSMSLSLYAPPAPA